MNQCLPKICLYLLAHPFKILCATCPYIIAGKSIKIKENENWNIQKKVNCETYNCIYLIECNKCKKRYIGQTGRQFKHRIGDHRGYINNQVWGQPIGAHFNQPGHCLANMKTIVLEQVKTNDKSYRLEREKYFINKFNTYYEGLNKEC